MGKFYNRKRQKRLIEKGEKASPESQIEPPQSTSQNKESPKQSEWDLASILILIVFLAVIGLVLLVCFKQADYERVHFAKNALYFIFDFSPGLALFLFYILAVFPLSLVKEKYLGVALFFTVLIGLGVWVFFSCNFYYINQDGIHRFHYSGNKTISWNQVKQVQLDVVHPSKSIPKLVYTLVTDEEDIELNDGTQSGSLMAVDKLLTKLGLRYYTGDIDSEDEEDAPKMNKINQAILKRHYRYKSK